MSNAKKELKNLLNRTAAALETPKDLQPEDVSKLIEDLLVAANDLDNANKRPYTDAFDADQQISLEEKISCFIAAAPEKYGHDADLEEVCQKLGSDILYAVVKELRPDLLEKP